jgi:hypothetical protein
VRWWTFGGVSGPILTSDTSASIEPSGENTIGGCTPDASFVTCRMLPPSASATNACISPSRFEMNAMCLPSGAHRGVFSVLSPPINSFGALAPSAATT